jgi:chromosome segregation ATPase
MNEQERRQEILKAEEVIRQLAVELGRTKDAASLAEKARDALVQASTHLERARVSLDEATASVGATRDRCIAEVSTACDKAKEAIRSAEAAVGRTAQAFDAAALRLESVARELQDSPRKLAETLTEVQAKLRDEVVALAETQKSEIGRLNKLLRIVIAVSAGALLLGLLRFAL